MFSIIILKLTLDENFSLKKSTFLISIPGKVVPYGNVRFKGATIFCKNYELTNFELHNFFVFDSNKKLLKILAKPNNFSHTAKFWNIRLPHQPEISICPKNCIFLPLGGLVTKWCEKNYLVWPGSSTIFYLNQKQKKLCNFKVGQFGIFKKHGCLPL